jgi:hypothetical protein
LEVGRGVGVVDFKAARNRVTSIAVAKVMVTPQAVRYDAARLK